jgi:short-subunit dehydrogenase
MSNIEPRPAGTGMRTFITGASSGLGEALARHYGTAGTNVGLLARRASLLERLAEELRARGASVRVYPGDVSDTAEVRRAAEDFVAQAAGIDLVIANAGVGRGGSLLDGDASSVARLMAVNVIGVTNTIVPFVPVMLGQKSGTLVAMSSMAGHRGLPWHAAYAASKAAVIRFMDGLRIELAGTGVHAMTLCPGFVRTAMTDHLGAGLPFLLEPEAAANLMARAITRRARTFTLPWQMALLRGLFVHAPEWLVRRMLPQVFAQESQ